MDPKMFRNLETNKVEVPAKFGQAGSSGLEEKEGEQTSEFVDI